MLLLCLPACHAHHYISGWPCLACPALPHCMTPTTLQKSCLQVRVLFPDESKPAEVMPLRQAIK
jgi:hypothetical protein